MKKRMVLLFNQKKKNARKLNINLDVPHQDYSRNSMSSEE